MLSKLAQFLGRDRRMLGGVIPKVQRPDDRPDEAERPNHEERASPRHQHNEPRHQRRRNGVADARKRMGDALAEPRFLAGSQSDIARVAVGSADTPMPSRTRL